MAKSKMSDTAKQYFSDSGSYTGYRGPKSNRDTYSVDGAVTRPHKSKPFKPGLGIGDAVSSIRSHQRRLRSQ